jgi:hypothetical protein
VDSEGCKLEKRELDPTRRSWRRHFRQGLVAPTAARSCGAGGLGTGAMWRRTGEARREAHPPSSQLAIQRLNRAQAPARPPAHPPARPRARSPARPPARLPCASGRPRGRARPGQLARPPARASAPNRRAGNRRRATRQAGPGNALAAADPGRAAATRRRPRRRARRSELASAGAAALGRRAFAALSIAGMFNFSGLGPGPMRARARARHTPT